jgi:hypothetical protein
MATGHAVPMHDELTGQMDRFARCVMERDEKLATSVLDDEFALELVHPAPAVVPRASWLAMLPDYVVHSWTEHDRALSVDGDCATLLHRVDMSATVLGEDRSGLFVMTDIWRRRPEGWRVWRRHSSPMTAGRMPGSS